MHGVGGGDPSRGRADGRPVTLVDQALSGRQSGEIGRRLGSPAPDAGRTQSQHRDQAESDDRQQSKGLGGT
jgi:hypothetical protein